MNAATPEDIATVCKLLERLRAGENTLGTAGNMGVVEIDAPIVSMFQRVESVLSAHLRRMHEPLGDGGPAFPTNTENSPTPGACYANYGMSLRDYFAAHAAEADVQAALEDMGRDSVPTGLQSATSGAERVARARYFCADAMLKARQS